MLPQVKKKCVGGFQQASLLAWFAVHLVGKLVGSESERLSTTRTSPCWESVSSESWDRLKSLLESAIGSNSTDWTFTACASPDRSQLPEPRQPRGERREFRV